MPVAWVGMGARAGWVVLGWSVVLAAAFVGLLVVLRRRRGRVDVVAVLVAATGVALLALPLAALVTSGARLDLFGLAALAWWGVVAGVPLAAVGALALRPTRPVVVLASAAIVLPTALGVWGMVVEPRHLETVEATVAVDPARAGTAPVRLGVLSDLQFRHVGDHEQAAVDRVMAAMPDVVLIAGDIYQGDDAGFDLELPAIRGLLGGLHAPGGVFLVGGDVDQPVSRLPRMVEGTDVRILANEVVETRIGDRTVRIGGVELAYDSPAAQAMVHGLEADPRIDDVRVLLAHRPDVASTLPPGARTDLVVAGHTHGGQISVPGIGPLATASSVPRHVAAGGLHDLGGTRIFVTTGVGMERGQAPPVRLGAHPTVAVLTLSTAA